MYFSAPAVLQSTYVYTLSMFIEKGLRERALYRFEPSGQRLRLAFLELLSEPKSLGCLEFLVTELYNFIFCRPAMLARWEEVTQSQL